MAVGEVDALARSAARARRRSAVRSWRSPSATKMIRLRGSPPAPASNAAPRPETSRQHAHSPRRLTCLWRGFVFVASPRPYCRQSTEGGAPTSPAGWAPKLCPAVEGRHQAAGPSRCPSRPRSPHGTAGAGRGLGGVEPGHQRRDHQRAAVSGRELGRHAATAPQAQRARRGLRPWRPRPPAARGIAVTRNRSPGPATSPTAARPAPPAPSPRRRRQKLAQHQEKGVCQAIIEAGRHPAAWRQQAGATRCAAEAARRCPLIGTPAPPPVAQRLASQQGDPGAHPPPSDAPPRAASGAAMAMMPPPPAEHHLSAAPGRTPGWRENRREAGRWGMLPIGVTRRGQEPAVDPAHLASTAEKPVPLEACRRPARGAAGRGQRAKGLKGRPLTDLWRGR